MTPSGATPASLADTARQLQTLSKRIQRQIMRKAMSRVGTAALKIMRQYVPREVGTDTLARARAGTLRKSLGRKVVVRGGVTTAIIGPRRGFKKLIGTRVRGPNIGQAIYYDPVKTAHLVDRGTVRSIAIPFTMPTRERMAEPAAQMIAETIQEELEKRA